MKKPYTNELALFSMMWNSEQSKIIRDYIHTLEGDLVNANVEVKMLQEQLAKLSIVEDIAENLLDPSDTRLADAEETIATKDAVIEAQSERVAELKRALKQIDGICGEGGNARIPKIERLIMGLQLAESEADNG